MNSVTAVLYVGHKRISALTLQNSWSMQIKFYKEDLRQCH